MKVLIFILTSLIAISSFADLRVANVTKVTKETVNYSHKYTVTALMPCNAKLVGPIQTVVGDFGESVTLQVVIDVNDVLDCESEPRPENFKFSVGMDHPYDLTVLGAPLDLEIIEVDKIQENYKEIYEALDVKETSRVVPSTGWGNSTLYTKAVGSLTCTNLESISNGLGPDPVGTTTNLYNCSLSDDGHAAVYYKLDVEVEVRAIRSTEISTKTLGNLKCSIREYANPNESPNYSCTLN